MQLTKQQLNAARIATERTRAGKQMQITGLIGLRESLGELRESLPILTVGLLQGASDYIAGQIEVLDVEVEQLDLTLRAIKSQESGLVGGVILPPTNHRPG